jgi:hypothetical protein
MDDYIAKPFRFSDLERTIPLKFASVDTAVKVHDTA